MSPQKAKLLSGLVVVLALVILGGSFYLASPEKKHEAEANEGYCWDLYNACMDQCVYSGSGDEFECNDNVCSDIHDACEADRPLPPGNNPLGPEPGVVEPNF